MFDQRELVEMLPDILVAALMNEGFALRREEMLFMKK